MKRERLNIQREKNLSILNKLQTYSDEVCTHFDIPYCKLGLNYRWGRTGKGATYGEYTYSKDLIEIGAWILDDREELIETLIHELAHHLHYSKAVQQVPGFYYIKLKWNPTGLKTKIVMNGRMHGTHFKLCYLNVHEFFVKALGIYTKPQIKEKP